jgi:hypothetical protein
VGDVVTTYSETPLFGPADPATVSDVTAVASDWRRESDRALIAAAIRRVAARDGGRVDTNHVRAELTGEHGLTVNPRVLSASYMALKHAGVLRWDGEWTEIRDTAGNSGKPTRVYQFIAPGSDGGRQ